MWYALWIADFREPMAIWAHCVVLGYAWMWAWLMRPSKQYMLATFASWACCVSAWHLTRPCRRHFHLFGLTALSANMLMHCWLPLEPWPCSLASKPAEPNHIGRHIKIKPNGLSEVIANEHDLTHVNCRGFVSLHVVLKNALPMGAWMHACWNRAAIRVAFPFAIMSSSCRVCIFSITLCGNGVQSGW